MNTKAILVLLATASALGTVPLSAQVVAAEHQAARQDFDADRILDRLRDLGVNASAVEEWGDLVRAYVLIDGRQVMQYFDADTLTPVDA